MCEFFRAFSESFSALKSSPVCVLPFSSALLVHSIEQVECLKSSFKKDLAQIQWERDSSYGDRP